MQPRSRGDTLLRRSAWLAGLLPLVIGAGALRAQGAPTSAAQVAAAVKGSLGRPKPGQVIFNDRSPKPSHRKLGKATYVGYQVCAGCHGALNSTRPDHTIIQEWESASNAHAKDGTKLLGFLNVYDRNVADGVAFNGMKKCGTCHATGSPDFDQEQTSIKNGFNPNTDQETPTNYLHNGRFLRVQCESCHGPASLHVLSGGDRRLINRIPDPKQTCWNCHAAQPNEKGNLIQGPVTDDQIAPYSSSLAHSHAAGRLATGGGGYEYAGEDYSAGHSQPHTRIATTCVTCHTARDARSPILDHSTLKPRIEVCRDCHGDARKVEAIEEWRYVKNRQHTIERLLIMLGGSVTENGEVHPDANAAGGLLGGAADKTSADYKRARWNHSLVYNDGSLGVHNFDYALELLLSSISHAPAQASGTRAPSASSVLRSLGLGGR